MSNHPFFFFGISDSDRYAYFPFLIPGFTVSSSCCISEFKNFYFLSFSWMSGSDLPFFSLSMYSFALFTSFFTSKFPKLIQFYHFLTIILLAWLIFHFLLFFCVSDLNLRLYSFTFYNLFKYIFVFLPSSLHISFISCIFYFHVAFKYFILSLFLHLLISVHPFFRLLFPYFLFSFCMSHSYLTHSFRHFQSSLNSIVFHHYFCFRISDYDLLFYPFFCYFVVWS